MADKKVSELTALATVSGDDLLLVVNDPSGTPASRKVTIEDFFSTVPADADVQGTLTVRDSVYLRGDSMVVDANTNMTATLTLGGISDVEGSIKDRMQVANTNLLVNDRLQVANAAATYATITGLNDRMQVANTIAYLEAELTAAGEVYYERDYIDTTFATKTAPTFSGTTTTDRIVTDNIDVQQSGQANAFTITTSTGLIVDSPGNNPPSSNALVEDIRPGTIWYTKDYLYIAVDLHTIKRVDLETGLSTESTPGGWA